MVELLSPGGSIESMKAAFTVGADAIYMGGQLFGARAYAENPDPQHLYDAIDYCHMFDKKMYLTINTLLKEKELENTLYDYMRPIYEHGVDAVLVQDLGVFRFLRKHFPDLTLHASTQMSIQSADGARLLKSMGASRIVPAREISLEEIRKIKSEVDIEIESFVHGAMCYSYSGQCLMSSMIGGRSGNRGRCAQPCRQKYQAIKRDGNDAISKSGYFLSMKDSCTLDILPDLIDAGICSFKIEGRMKQPEYAAGVTEIYRKYIDLYLDKGRQNYLVDEEDRRILLELFNRGGFSRGYYQAYNGPKLMAMDKPNHAGTPAVKIRKIDNKQMVGEALEPLYENDLLSYEQKKTAPQRKGMTGKKGQPVKKSSSTYTMQRNAKKGDRISLPLLSGVSNNQVLARVRSEHLFGEIRQRMQAEPKIMLYGHFTMHAGKQILLEVSNVPMDARENDPHGRETAAAIHITVCAEAPQIAQNHSIMVEDVKKQLYKTGGTVFEWAGLSIDIDDNLFIPLKSLNELRRSAFARYEEALLQTYFKNHAVPSEGTESVMTHAAEDHAKDLHFGCFVRTLEQLRAAVESDAVDEIIIDSLIWPKKLEASVYTAWIEKIHACGKTCILAMPPVWRSRAKEVFESYFTGEMLTAGDGIMLRCIDQMQWEWLKTPEASKRSEQGFDIISDYNIYNWNTNALLFLKSRNILRHTIPVELTEQEMAFADKEHDSIVLYGRTVMMTSAQCVMKNAFSCDSSSARVELVDAKRVVFPVLRHCNICTNEILNSFPTDLSGLLSDMQKDGIKNYRLDFTVETYSETKQLLNNLRDLLRSGAGNTYIAAADTTRGHFRRAVE